MMAKEIDKRDCRKRNQKNKQHTEELLRKKHRYL